MPFGVVLKDSVPGESADTEPELSLEATARLDAVDPIARHYGARPGQSIVEARVLVSALVVREISRRQVRDALGRVAEVALGFGAPAAIEEPDTVWLDVTGSAHLAGGESALAAELEGRVRAMGHVARAAVAGGPRLAQAFARWSPPPPAGEATIIESHHAAEKIAPLPVRALPLDADCQAWLMRLGIHTVGDLARLPRAAIASRLARDGGSAGTAALVLDLAEGRDPSPLVAYEPPARPVEEIRWEDPVDGLQPLLFPLRGLAARLGARLEGRGEAACAVDLAIHHDRSIARLRGAPASLVLRFDLAAPLWCPDELFRTLRSRLQRTRLAAPTVGLRLEASAITRVLALQLDLSRRTCSPGSDAATGPETLPVLLAELAADIGKDRVGVLSLRDTHRPEVRSRLEPVTPKELALDDMKGHRRRAADESAEAREASEDGGVDLLDGGRAPARLLPRPLPIGAALRAGATICIDHRLYSIEHIELDRRLDGVEWWTELPVRRDYCRLWLQSPQGGLEGIAYVDRKTGRRFLQAVFD